MNVSEAADFYLNLHLAVIPAIYGEKRPCVEWKKYQEKGPSNKEVKEWFKDKEQNIAVLCGVPSANLVVLDFDNISIYPKFFDTQALERETLVVKTGSGKLHVYLRSDKSVASFRIPQLKLEVRSDGNVVIAPPSKHPSGGFYEFVNKDVNKVMVVTDLVGAIWNKAEKLGIKAPTDLFIEDLHERGEQPYEGPDPPCIVALSKGVEEGMRNEAGMRLLSYWLKFKRDVDSEALKALKHWNRLNRPTLPETELKALAESVGKLDRSYGCRVNQAWCDLDRCVLLRNKLLRKEAEEEAEKILSAPKVLEALKPHLDNILAGEDDNKFLEFILLNSGRVSDPAIKQMLLLKSEPGAGKTHLMRIADAFRTKSVGRFSAHALDYSDLQSYEVLRLKELGSMDQEFQGVSTIKFLSADDKGYTVEVTERDERGRFTTKQYRVPPITIVTSTTRVDLDPQFVRRAWILNPDESQEQTDRIRKWKAKLEQEKNLVSLGLMKETSYDHSLRVLKAVVKNLEPCNVIMPFPESLTEILGFGKLRLRGDYDKFFGLVKLYGFLHQKTLPQIEGTNGHKAVLVLPQHAFEALKIAEKPYITMTTELEERTRKLVEKLEELNIKEKGDTVGIDERAKIAVELGLSEKTVKRYLKEWVTAGYLVEKQTGGRGSPLSFELIHDLATIKQKTSASLDITKITEEKRLKFQKEAESFLDAFRTKISYGRDWTEQKVREALAFVEDTHPWEKFVRKGVDEDLNVFSEKQPISLNNSAMSKVEGLDSEKKPESAKEPLSFDDLNLRDGPHQMVAEMYHEGVCYMCKQNRQISWYYSDFKGEKHELCTECGWHVSKELEKPR